MPETTHYLEGWKIRLVKSDGLLRFFAEAKHETHNKYQWADAVDMRDALLRLADATKIDASRMLTVFGIEP